MEKVYGHCPECDNDEDEVDGCEYCDNGRFEMDKFDRFLEGVGIIRKIYPDEEYMLDAEHDIIYLGNEDADEMTPGRYKKRLEELGFDIDSDVGRWTFST